MYDSILDYISHIKESIVHNEGTRKLDYRIFRFLFQYKKLMLMRLEYISENNTDLGEIPEEYKEEYLCSKKIHGLALRFGVLNDTSILDKMSRYIIEMEKQDRIIFKKVIDKLL